VGLDIGAKLGLQRPAGMVPGLGRRGGLSKQRGSADHCDRRNAAQKNCPHMITPRNC
jgi:hypothetical protein